MNRIYQTWRITLRLVVSFFRRALVLAKAACKGVMHIVKIHGECLTYALICVLILGWVQQNDAESNARFAKDTGNTAYAYK